MAKERMVNTKFWDDSYIVTLDPVEKLLYLYFLTNPLTNICGVYEIQLRRVAFDTGIDKDMVQKIIDRFSRDNKIHYIDGWLVVQNFIKHQKNNPKVQKGIVIGLEQVPEHVLSFINKEKGHSLSKPMIDNDRLSHSNSNSNSNSNLNSNINITPRSDVLPAKKLKPEPKPKAEPKAPTPYTPEVLEEKLQEMEKNEGSYLDIIATFIREKPVRIENSKQLSLVISRFAKIAKTAEGAYTNKQIFTAIEEIKRENWDRERKGQVPIDWTVETIVKKLTK